MFFRIKNMSIGFFRWFGFSIKRGYGMEYYDNVLYVNLGFIAIDIGL